MQKKTKKNLCIKQSVMDTLVDSIKHTFFSEEFVDTEVIEVLIKYQTNARKLQKRLMQFNVGGVSDIICKSVSKVIKHQIDENKETVAEFREKNSRLIRKTKVLQLQNDTLIQKNQCMDLEKSELLAERDSLIHVNGVIANDLKLIRKSKDEVLQTNKNLIKCNDNLITQITIADQMKATLQTQNEIMKKRITDLEKELSNPISITSNISVPLQIICI